MQSAITIRHTASSLTPEPCLFDFLVFLAEREAVLFALFPAVLVVFLVEADFVFPPLADDRLEPLADFAGLFFCAILSPRCILRIQVLIPNLFYHYNTVKKKNHLKYFVYMID